VGFISAIKFLTIIPLFGRHEDSQEAMGRSIVYFPVVGLVIGLFLVGVNWLSSLFLPPAMVSGLLVISVVIISGALHLDGFVDTCDGIAGHKSVEDRWKVMKDSRAGAFGIIGITLLLLFKYISLSSVPGNLLPASLIIMPVVSRWTVVFALFAYPYARSEGLGKTVKLSANRQRFSIATVITLTLVTGMAWLADISYFYLAGPAIMLGTWVIIVLAAGYFKRKFAGLTGDTYGAINEVAEVGVLIIIILLSYNNWLI